MVELSSLVFFVTCQHILHCILSESVCPSVCLSHARSSVCHFVYCASKSCRIRWLRFWSRLPYFAWDWADSQSLWIVECFNGFGCCMSGHCLCIGKCFLHATWSVAFAPSGLSLQLCLAISKGYLVSTTSLKCASEYIGALMQFVGQQEVRRACKN